MQNASASDPMAPGLPPAMASIRSYTADELVQVMNKTPLFMSNLDDVGDEGLYIPFLPWAIFSILRSKMTSNLVAHCCWLTLVKI